MIRIRTTDNKIIDLPKDALFVEIVNDEDDIACVINEDPSTSTYSIFDYSDFEKAKRYSDFFKVKFVKKIINITKK